MRNAFLNTLFLSLLASLAFSQKNLDTASFNMAIPQASFNTKSLVIIGEAHPIGSTYGTELLMVEHFVEKGFRTIYLESGESDAVVINMYMESGDSTMLKYCFARWRNWSYYKEFLKPYYAFIQAKGYKTTFKGFDYERPVAIGFLFSKWFGTATISTIDFKALSALLLSGDEYGNKANFKKLEATLAPLRAAFAANPDPFKEILQDRLAIFKSIVYNPIPGVSQRDPTWIKSFLEADKMGTLDKSIVATGLHHMMTKGQFVPELTEKLPDTYTILAFPFIYVNCKYAIENKKFTSSRRRRKFTSQQPVKTPLILFTSTTQKVIPSASKSIETILVELYNQ
jgi:hypothetical protein